MARTQAAVVVLAVVVLAGGRPAVAVGKDAAARERLFARALELHQAGDILGAIEAYQEFLQDEPGHVQARSNLGAAYARLGRYLEAIQQYRQALVESGHAGVRFNLALTLHRAARVPEAAEELARVLAVQPDNKAARLLLADCYLQLGKDREVIDLLSPVEPAFAEDRGYAYLLGTALIRQNELDRGQVLIDRVLGAGESAEARLLLGAAHSRVQDHKGALEQLSRARELNPRLALVNSLYGRALMATGDREGAAEAFLKELEVNPNDFEANLYLGLLRKDDQRLDEAFAFLQRAARMRPRDPNLLYSLGSLHVARGDLGQAVSLLEDVVKEAPAFVQAHVLLATVYYRLKRKEDGDRERTIVEKLNQELQARAPGAQATGEAYRGQAQPASDPGPPKKAPPP